MKKKTANFSLVIVSLCCLLAVLGYFSAVTGATEPEGNQKIVIAYSSNVEGYLEPCG